MTSRIVYQRAAAAYVRVYLFTRRSSSTTNSTAPMQMALSATLKAGQCQPATWKSRKSITWP